MGRAPYSRRATSYPQSRKPQDLDLFVCLRPVRYFNGIETPVKAPEKVDMVVFRENTEDIYAGIEFKEGTEDAKLFFAAA